VLANVAVGIARGNAAVSLVMKIARIGQASTG
jgi:hypothetical protein